MTGALVVEALHLAELRKNLEARGLLGPAAALAVAYGVELADVLLLEERSGRGRCGACRARRADAARRALWGHMRNYWAMSWGEMAALLRLSRSALVRSYRKERGCKAVNLTR